MKSFTLDKLRSKVSGRRFSDPSDSEQPSASPHKRHNSVSSAVKPTFASDDHLRASVSSRIRASSLSLHNERSPRSRSRSVSKKQAKELIHHETSQVIHKKLSQVLQGLDLQLPIPLKSVASGLGATPSKSIKIYIANTNDCVYLAPSSSTSSNIEEAENGGSQIPEQGNISEEYLTSDGPGASSSDASTMTSIADIAPGCSTDAADPTDVSNSILNTMKRKMKVHRSMNYLSSQIDSDTSIPHLFAVIVELKKKSNVKKVEIDFSSTVRTLWPSPEYSNKPQTEESFRIGSMQWDLDFSDADYFISTKNSNDTRSKDLVPHQLANKSREYRLIDARKASTTSLNDRNSTSCQSRSSIDHSAAIANFSATVPDTQKAGFYVFLLPILFPSHIPATVLTANGSLSHRLSIKVPGVQERSTRKCDVVSNYNLPMVRTPPSLANSVADKPIFVNRTWNDSLHYAITFPRKYVSLGSEHTINVKLVPLVKNVTVKRIKFNILERTTILSKDLTKEYVFDGNDTYTSKSSKIKERIVPLCELKTKNKSTYGSNDPFKEEILSCPENNLLFSCYENKSKSSYLSKRENNSVMVASPLDISIALPFLTTKADKEIKTGCLADFERDPHSSMPSSTSRRSSLTNKDPISSFGSPSSPSIGSIETQISHTASSQLQRDSVSDDVLKLSSSSLISKTNTDRYDSISNGYTSVAKALSPDSNFRHIQISHRLQVCFRISKPDPKDNDKVHHYEVVVDTPIILLSAKCNDESIQLPRYNEIGIDLNNGVENRPAIAFRTPSYNGVSIKPLNCADNEEQLPSFEEAISVPNSPVTGFASPAVAGPRTPLGPAPSYEGDSSRDDDLDVIEPLNIDDVLVDPQRSLSQRKPSAIKASLQTFLAPSIYSSHSTSTGSDPSQEENSTTSSSPTNLNNTTSEESSGEMTSSDSMRSDLIDNQSQSSKSLHLPCEDDCGHLNESDFVPKNEIILGDSETQSIATQDIHFVQRLPLLRNESIDDVATQMSEVNLRGGNLGMKSCEKLSTENLHDDPQPQTLFHAF